MTRCDKAQMRELSHFAATMQPVDKQPHDMIEAALQFTVMGDDHREIRLELSRPLGGGEPRSSAFSGVKGLLLAVLEDGIRSYLSPVKELRAEAEYWVSSSRARSPFCFVVICETLGLEPSAVRDGLARLRSQRVNPARALGRTRPNVRRAHRVSHREVG